MPLTRLLKGSLSESNSELQLLLNVVAESLCGLDAAGNITFCNDAFLKLIQYSTEETIGNNVDGLLRHSCPTETTDPSKECAVGRVLESQQEIHIVGDVFWRKDGTSFPAEYWCRPLQLPSSGTEYVLTIHDITGRSCTEEELRRSQDCLAESQRLTHIGSWSWRTDQRESVFWSEEHYRIFGMELGTGRMGFEESMERLHPEDAPIFRRLVQESIATKKGFETELRIILPDGSIRKAHGVGRPLIDKAGNVVEFVGTTTDVTDRRRAEKELRLAQFSLEHSAGAVDWVDANGRFVYVNEGTCRQLGRSREELLSLSIPDIAPLITKEGWDTMWQELKVRGSMSFETKNKSKQGRVFPVEVNVSYLKFDGEEYAFAFVRDISERQKAEERLRKLSSAVEQSPAIVVITDTQGTIEYVNCKFTQVTGYTAEEAIGQNPRILKSGMQSAAVYRELWGTVLAGGEWHGEFANKKKNGDTYWESATIVPISDSSGAITHFLALKEDITARIKAEEKVRLMQFSLENASEALYWIDSQARIVYVNQAACRSLERSREELLSLSIPDIDPCFPEDRWPWFWQELTTHGSLHFETQHRTKQGHAFPVEVNASYLKVDGKEYSFCFVRDITERKRAEEKLRESNELVRLVLDSVPEAVYGIDMEGKCTFCNPACLRLLGYQEPADLHGKNMHDVMHHTREDGTPYPVEECHIYEAFRRGHGTHIDDEVIWRRDGTSFPAEYWSHPIHRDGRPIGTVVTFVNITARKRAEEVVRESERRYRLLFERNLAGVFRTTMDGRILECNQAAAQMFGCDSPEEILGTSIVDVYQTISDREAFLRKLKREKYVTNYEVNYRRKNGDSAWAMLNATVVSDEAGTVSFIEGTFVDITERKVAEERIQSLAYFDALTGLPNRTLLRDRLSLGLASARRKKSKVALFFLDLDRFKNINDSLGHSVGDLLLKGVAERLKAWGRDQDTIARLGGDEFLVVVNDVKYIADAAVAAQRLMDGLTAEMVIQGHSLSVSCSLGISIYPEHGTDSETLIKHADAAMYTAKDSGRNNFQFFTADMNAQAVERLNLENSLRTALDKKELFLMYQPQMDIASRKIVGVEALLRWQHPEMGLVPPDDFIRIAENSGLIMPIGEWVLRTACSQARKWQDEGLGAVSVAVNVSAVQFRREGFSEVVRQVLVDTGLAPQYLELEVTESLLLSSADVTFPVLQELKDMGLSLAIDDFGTGYSSLSYLKRFPVSKLKIDRSFVRDVALNPDDAAITTAIISMARSLNLKVIAEGVENEAQMSFLRAHHCDEIQGYYFSKPLAAIDVAAKLRADCSEAHVESQASRKQSGQRRRASMAKSRSPSRGSGARR
jgi:diguanylate cyclase (GGDEF)-like protein/PAS domain S-box-containing protein